MPDQPIEDRLTEQAGQIDLLWEVINRMCRNCGAVIHAAEECEHYAKISEKAVIGMEHHANRMMDGVNQKMQSKPPSENILDL